MTIPPPGKALSTFLQQKILFRPTLLKANHTFHFDQPFEEIWLDTDEPAIRLNALFFPAQRQPSRGVVLYFHGNRDNLQRWGGFAGDFTGLGFDFFCPDYRGYGKTPGTPNEAAYYADAERAYLFLRKKYPPERIVLYGRSLGTGLAAYLAAHVDARMLILETPFDNIHGLLASHLRRNALPFQSAFHFPNDRHVRKAPMPVLIFHGTRDHVVPYSCAVHLKKCLKPGDEFVTIEGGSHSNLREFSIYREQLEAWLAA